MYCWMRKQPLKKCVLHAIFGKPKGISKKCVFMFTFKHNKTWFMNTANDIENIAKFAILFDS